MFHKLLDPHSIGGWTLRYVLSSYTMIEFLFKKDNHYVNDATKKVHQPSLEYIQSTLASMDRHQIIPDEDKNTLKLLYYLALVNNRTHSEGSNFRQLFSTHGISLPADPGTTAIYAPYMYSTFKNSEGQWVVDKDAPGWLHPTNLESFEMPPDTPQEIGVPSMSPEMLTRGGYLYRTYERTYNAVVQSELALPELPVPSEDVNMREFIDVHKQSLLRPPAVVRDVREARIIVLRSPEGVLKNVLMSPAPHDMGALQPAWLKLPPPPPASPHRLSPTRSSSTSNSPIKPPSEAPSYSQGPEGVGRGNVYSSSSRFLDVSSEPDYFGTGYDGSSPMVTDEDRFRYGASNSPRSAGGSARSRNSYVEPKDILEDDDGFLYSANDPPRPRDSFVESKDILEDEDGFLYRADNPPPASPSSSALASSSTDTQTGALTENITGRRTEQPIALARALPPRPRSNPPTQMPAPVRRSTSAQGARNSPVSTTPISTPPRSPSDNPPSTLLQLPTGDSSSRATLSHSLSVNTAEASRRSPSGDRSTITLGSSQGNSSSLRPPSFNAPETLVRPSIVNLAAINPRSKSSTNPPDSGSPPATSRRTPSGNVPPPPSSSKPPATSPLPPRSNTSSTTVPPQDNNPPAAGSSRPAGGTPLPTSGNLPATAYHSSSKRIPPPSSSPAGLPRPSSHKPPATSHPPPSGHPPANPPSGADSQRNPSSTRSKNLPVKRPSPPDSEKNEPPPVQHDSRTPRPHDTKK